MLRAVSRYGADSLARLGGHILPPRRLLAQTSSPTRWEFAAAGRVGLECCRLGGLGPDDRVLDIGSGVGRVAIPLTGVLSPAGSYLGVDVWPEGVDWCTKAITPRFPRFTFRHLDLVPDDATPPGEEAGTPVRLPFDDGAFDFAILVAINHLSLATLRALVDEAGRVLRSGGTYVGTWFLVDHSTEARLPPTYGAVAGTDDVMHATLAGASLAPRQVHRGAWRGEASAVSFQDVVIAGKS